MIGFSFPRNDCTAASSIPLINAALGDVLIVQLTTAPSKQSIIGDRYTLPLGMRNSVISVIHFSFILSALKLRFNTLGTAGDISPSYELYFLILIDFTRRSSSRMMRRTIFSETMISIFFNDACIRL